MRYHELPVQTQREAPNNARTPGFAFLVRAGYLTREKDLTPLGQYALHHLRKLVTDPSFRLASFVPSLSGGEEIFFPLPTGDLQLIHCPACGYAARQEWAIFAKAALPAEEPLPLEKVSTPECHTIQALAKFLNLPEEKTAKALMYTRLADGKFVFVVIRGDMQLSEAKLKQQVGEVRPATAGEIAACGATAGYASPIGLRDALVMVDDLIPQSANLVAGANEDGYHLKHVNYGRDYAADIVADLAQAQAGNPCVKCGGPLTEQPAIRLATRQEFDFVNILLALAETYHDEKGLSLPHPAAPFDVYLMHLPGKTIDTRAATEDLYAALQTAGLSVLFDDRDERAGVKFNDADLIGCPVRITIGERGLKEGMVELKQRAASLANLIPLTRLTGHSPLEFWNLVDNLVS
ncbi:MAG: YbaK/EbsC family protein [Anaerolineales bacterium]